MHTPAFGPSFLSLSMSVLFQDKREQQYTGKGKKWITNMLNAHSFLLCSYTASLSSVILLFTNQIRKLVRYLTTFTEFFKILA